MPGFRTGSRTYQLTCNNPAGSVTRSVTIYVTDPRGGGGGGGCGLRQICVPPPQPASQAAPDKSVLGKPAQNVNSAAGQQTTTYTIQRITYRLAGQPIAVRVSGDPNPANNGLHYLYADHLGGINAIQRQNGGLEQMRYTPFGGYRLGNPSQLTDRAYTGQQENMDLGLYYYNARYYAPYLNRFISADTIVPNHGDPQSFNRYVYTRNNPLKYVDSNGHCWGAASFIRDWNINTPLGTIGGGTNCANIDMALTIVQHPDATPAQKAQAGIFLGGWGFAAISGTAGTGLLACSTVAPYAAAAETALGLGA